MKIKQFAILLMAMYVLISPLLLISTEHESYKNGFQSGFNFHIALMEEIKQIQAEQQAQLPIQTLDKGLMVNYSVKSTDEYHQYFNESFYGIITDIYFDDKSVVAVLTDSNESILISEYWIEISDAP